MVEQCSDKPWARDILLSDRNLTLTSEQQTVLISAIVEAEDDL